MPTQVSREQFEGLIARESDEVELKTGLGGRPLQEAIVAFSNTRGGTIYVGVTDGREVRGRRRDQGVDDAIHEAALAARNVGRYEIDELDVEGTPVVRVTVQERADEVAQTSDGRVLQRRGGRNVPLFGSDLWGLVSGRALRRYEHASSHVGVDAVLSPVAQMVAEAHGWAAGRHLERWRERNLLHEDGTLTVAGALLLTDPSTTLGAAKFVIDLRSYESDETRSYVRRDVVAGPVQHQAETATSWVLRDVGTEIVVTGPMRHDVPRLPPRVVREAIANAVAHRDYSHDRSPIVVEVRPSAVRIVSPGRLPAPVTIATLRESQAPRNHTVIDVLRRLGLAEDSGQGIDVMQDGMRLELLEEPEFEEGEDWFAVTLRLRGQVSTSERAWLAELERQGRLRSDDRLLLLLALRERRISNSRAREALGVDSVEARGRLRRLRDAGLLEQHGTRGRAYYTPGVIGPDRTAQAIVLDAARRGPLTNAAVRALTGLERLPALRLLQRLVSEGELVQEGQRRATRYRLPG